MNSAMSKAPYGFAACEQQFDKESVLQRAKELSIPVSPSLLASNGNVPALSHNYRVVIKPVHSKAGARRQDVDGEGQ